MSFQLDPDNNSPQQGDQTRRKSPIARLLNLLTILGLAFFLAGGYLILKDDLTISTEFNQETLLYLGRYVLVLLGVYLIVKGINKASAEARSASAQF